MKVLLALERFAPDFGGGGEALTLELARQIVRLGGEVEIVTSGDPALTEYEGFETTRLGGNRYWLNLRAGAIEEAARGCDVIHTTTYHACLPALRAARRLGLPVVCQVMGFFEAEWTRMRGPLMGRAFQRWEQFLVTRSYDRIIFPSDYTIGPGLALGADAQRAGVITPGVDIDLYGPASTKEDVVLFSGKLEQRKGIEEFLAVAARLPHVQFEVCGWGPETQRYRKGCPANVRFTRFERGARLRETLGRARIALLPSWRETFGLVVIEAMASGCAVVSSIDLEFAGISVEAGDVAAMAEAVDKLWSDPRTCQTMGERNVELARVHSWDRYGDKFYATYEQVLAERAEARR